ncbi:hypothetical protein H1R20_g2859, partial [Candolleomyces eurysporus]
MYRSTDDQKGKRPRRSEGSTSGELELSPASAWKASKRPRIVSKIHATLQGVCNPGIKSARRNELSREEKEVLNELAMEVSPRRKKYPGIGMGRPSCPPEASGSRIQTAVFERTPTVSHIIESLMNDFSDTDEEDSNQDNQGGAGTSSTEAGNFVRAAAKQIGNEDDEDDDSDWSTDDGTSDTGSSDLYSVVDESLGYVTSEDGSLLGEVVNQAILEASLEDLKVVDVSELESMDRAKKRLLLRESDLAYLRRLQLKRLVDEVDIGSVLLDRLDQELRRTGLNATSVLRMMELTDTVISGSFVFPVLRRGTVNPNDLDFFTSIDSHLVVLSYLKKKGYNDRKQLYPQNSWRPGYGSNLQDIKYIFELKNRKAYKINVIVSKGRAILPIMQFHSTPVMNYIAYHGVVCLYDITLYQLGITNYVDMPTRVVACMNKYEARGFEIWGSFEEEHSCKIDGCCPQTIRTLFDRDVVHVRFPDYIDVSQVELRKNEAKIAVWRLATGVACKAPTNDNVGFVVCDSMLTVLRR